MSDFRLTEDHIKLLRHMYVGWQLCETGAPEIDPKRPYGNSSVWVDVAEILGWEVPDEEDDDYSDRRDELLDRAMELHRDTEMALQIVLVTGRFEPGLYRRAQKYFARSWEKVEE